MTIQSAKWTGSGSIEATYEDGTIKHVPDNMGNRDRRELDEWEQDGNIIEPYTAPVSEPRLKGTAREFMDIFTKEEKIAIASLTMSDPTIKLWYDEALAGEVWLDHPDVALGLGAMQLAGVVTAERAAEILATDFDA